MGKNVFVLLVGEDLVLCIIDVIEVFYYSLNVVI